MTPAVIYVRVSTACQALDGISLDAQEARARAWAAANGYAVASVHADRGVSGKRADNRLALQQALEAVCRQKGALVVYSLSRLARSTKDAIAIAERLDRAGADLVSLSERIDTTTAAGKMVFRMLAVLAEFERDLVSERTTAALAHLKSQGRRVGEIPFGYCLAPDGEHLVSDPGEQATLRSLRHLRGRGLTLRQVADTLNRDGATTKKGRPWTWRTVQNAAQ